LIEALDIQVKGVVQGVGFRPFVYRLAQRYQINGWVLNATDGVFIHAEGEAKHLDGFILEISENPPAAAQVTEIEMKEVPLEDFSSFEIRFSDELEVEKTTLISPDLATCEDCSCELFDPQDRRYHYPFINCTNCGPRFTIINALPYDRNNTSMSNFPMCEACQSEYDNPLDRRFHAQPNACFECGPHVAWLEPDIQSQQSHPIHPGSENHHPDSVAIVGATREENDAIFDRAVQALRAGKILAVKGLGGFHLVCDATNASALAELRSRKRRKGQGFAVMVQSLDEARVLCEVNEVEEKLLTGSQRPIVLLKKRADAVFAPGLADGLAELGVMLPYTPIQHLLLQGFGGMLVMTSANIHDEPIVTDDEEAQQVLAGVADAFLGHNRAIVARYDDSVVRVITCGEQQAIQLIRRARGYAPMPIVIPEQVQSSTSEDKPRPELFAAGSEQKNTFCLTRDNEAFVSQHIGDMENAETFDAWLEAKRRYETLFEIQPKLLVSDMHPEYLSTKWVHEQNYPHVEVQHHHAHIASVMAENSLEPPVVGFAFDGTGYGVDKNIWGGEVLLCNYQTFERFANFAYVPMPGAAAAIKHPQRMAYGALWAFDLLEHPQAKEFIEGMGQSAHICNQMIEKELNTPLTSSVGRLFDAASALLGVCVEPRYEGEGAILLEAAITPFTSDEPTDDDDAYRIEVIKNTATPESTAQDTSILLLDAAPVFKAMLDDLAKETPIGIIARRFHDAFVKAVVDTSLALRMMYDIQTIALSGGVFMNRYLVESLFEALPLEGFTVAINRELPPNDGCISFGQAVVALALNNE
jgi:hydrogenase maturation protein HypF